MHYPCGMYDSNEERKEHWREMVVFPPRFFAKALIPVEAVPAEKGDWLSGSPSGRIGPIAFYSLLENSWQNLRSESVVHVSFFGIATINGYLIPERLKAQYVLSV